MGSGGEFESRVKAPVGDLENELSGSWSSFVVCKHLMAPYTSSNAFSKCTVNGMFVETFTPITLTGF